MSRPKPFLTYFILCAVPLLLLAGLNYWNGIRAVDSTLSAIVQDDLNAFNVGVDEELRARERAILQLTITPAARDVVTVNEEESKRLLPQGLYLMKSLPDLSGYFQTVTFFDSERRPRCFRAGGSEWKFYDGRNTPSLPQPDPGVWTQQGNISLERRGDATFEYSAPIHNEQGTKILGAVVGVVDLETVLNKAADNQGSMLIVLDTSGKILYHTDRSRKLRPVNAETELKARTVMANQSGVGQFRSPTGLSYTAAYAPIPRLNIAVAVGRDRSYFVTSAHRWGMAGLALALLAAVAGAFLLERHVQRRSRGIERVTEDLSAIAKGELDRRIVLQSSDDARGLADNINVVTERLRAQIAREEESRQFESFVRLSAMLTHDLKNAIEGLSLTVANMERHFDNPQFRADALKGLTNAADKLKALVARLARPLTSLSGEHKRPTKVDLVPILQRVIAITAEPMRGKHTVVTRLPQSLYALTDAARIEEVIENLVLNALEAMDQSGTLTIEAGQTPNGAPMFSVSDTGRGMTRTFIDTRLFRPFSTTKKTGIGLGLYTCREVINASGGSIEVDSVEGAGTTFRVVLPSIPNDRRN